MTEEKQKEYLMLREEIVSHLKYQQKYSTFAITATITIIGFALQTSNSVVEMFLLPYIVLLLSSVKVSNYKIGIQKVVGYMIATLEHSDGFFWENSLNLFRKYEKTHNKIARRFIEILETQEFAFMATICLIIYEVMLVRAQPNYYITRGVICGIIAFCAIILMFKISMNYWNLNPDHVKKYVEIWNSLLNKKEIDENNENITSFHELHTK